MKILVADDDPTLRGELAELLREDGHAIVTAADGSEALHTVERESFDVALLDLRMPKASGLEVLHRLRVVRPETAVVMITGEGTIDTAVEAMKSGAIDFVEKPYDLEALRRTLRMVEEERTARARFGATRSEADISGIVSEAAGRGALLAVVGPHAKPPPGASRVLRIAEEGRPPNAFAPALLIFVLLSGPVMFWFSPLGHWWSRKYEYEADAFAAGVMNEPRSLIGALRKLNEKNLSNLTPHPVYSSFYYSHPTLVEREAALTKN